MIVECDSCHTRYNVDDTKVPVTGIKVRCHKCQHVLFIKREIPVSAPPEEKPQPVIERPSPPVEKPSVTPTYEVPPEPKVARPEMPATGVPIPEAKPKPTETVMSDEDKRWHERARRLAKALASDLVLYNKEKVERGLADNTLIQLLGGEIKRSWDYYCQQIPRHIVETSDYFKEQLNKIVGKGRQIFK